ncbi:hypothetical protein Acsp03_39760 [Actinomadura sp. NBRC 104412]|nr:hypothetical protein [Actinomadura sp. NBRC 104412]GLZ06510.1 hypothetical protein Acsp03_39760 [Actinomadura sp. NBRC 104412]
MPTVSLPPRAVYGELNPGTDAAEAVETVTSAVDALFVILEHAAPIA